MSGEIIQKYVGHSGKVYAVAVFDEELYSAAYDVALFKWSINDGLVTKKFDGTHKNMIISLAYKSQTLFTGSTDTTVIKWDAVSGEVLFRYIGRNSIIRRVASWKNFIISGGDDARIRMWDASTNSIDPFVVLNYDTSSILSLLVFEDEMYSSDDFGVMRAIGLKNLTLIKSFRSKNLINLFLIV